MPRPGRRSSEGCCLAGLDAVLVRLTAAFAAQALGAAVSILTAGTLTLGRADRRLRDRAERGMSAFMKADPGARLVRRRGTSSFRSVGLPVMKEAFQQRITVGVVPPMVLVPGVGRPTNLARDAREPARAPSPRSLGKRRGGAPESLLHPKVFPTCANALAVDTVTT